MISHIVDSLYFQLNKILSYKFNPNEAINFYRQPIYGELWDNVIISIFLINNNVARFRIRNVVYHDIN